MRRLTNDEEAELARRYRAGDRHAGDELLAAYEPLCEAVVRPVAFRGVEREDLLQAARMGLIRALESYDPSKGRLATYAPWQMRASMREVVLESRTVYLPSWVDEALRLATKRGVDAGSPEALAAAGLVSDRSEILVGGGVLLGRHVSLDAPAGGKTRETPSRTTVGDRMMGDAPTPEDAYTSAESAHLARDKVALLLQVLNWRERVVVERRLLVDGEPDSLQVIGKGLGLTRERVRQILETAKAKLAARARTLAHGEGQRRTT